MLSFLFVCAGCRGDRAVKAELPIVPASRCNGLGLRRACKPVALCASRVQIPSPALIKTSSIFFSKRSLSFVFLS